MKDRYVQFFYLKDENYLFSEGEDNTIRMWDLKIKREISIIGKHD